MRNFSDKEKVIINKIIYLDECPSTLNVLNNIIENIFDDNFYLKIESKTNCPVFFNKKYFDEMTGQYGSIWVNDVIKELTKSLWLLISLIKYLERENLIILSGDFEVEYLGVPIDDSEKIYRYSLEDKDLIENIYIYSRKRIITTESLKTLVKNDFKSIQEIQIINELKNNKKILMWTVTGVAIAGISFLVSIILQMYFPTPEIRLTNDELKIKIIDDVKEKISVFDSTNNNVINEDSVNNK